MGNSGIEVKLDVVLVVVDDVGSIVLVEVLLASVVVCAGKDVVRGVEVVFSVVDLPVVVEVVLVDVEVFVCMVSDRVVVGFDVVLIMVLVVLDNDAKKGVFVVEVVSPDVIIDLPVVSVLVDVDTETTIVKLMDIIREVMLPCVS